MRLPVMPPTSPMLARLARELPEPRPGALYEPKWDGFRAIVYRDGDEVEIESRGEKWLTRYFPELLDPFRHSLPDRCVVDGEIVVARPERPGAGDTGPHGLDFNLLQQRIHPAASRIELLAGETPASFIAFDLLALGERDLRPEPFAERRRLLEEALAGPRARAAPQSAEHSPIHLTPATTDPSKAAQWLERFVGAGLDGVVVKDPALPYQEGKRVMVKVKLERTAECVVAGYRLHKDGKGAGSLLLGLYDAKGVLHHAGVASAFSAPRRDEILAHVRPYEMASPEGHPWAAWRDEASHETQLMPGTPSRWSGAREKSADWAPLAPELVAEVHYEHLQGARFRNPARFVRWRPDRTPESCTYDQLVVAPPTELQTILG